MTLVLLGLGLAALLILAGLVANRSPRGLPPIWLEIAVIGWSLVFCLYYVAHAGSL